jgi:hypothetical protein
MVKRGFAGLLILMMSLTCCKIDQDKKADPSKFQFTVREDADLFFRNVRQVYYDRSSPDGTWQAYRFSNRYTGNEKPMLTPVIVIHWLKDEAYLLIENNQPLDDEEFISVLIQNSETKMDTIELKERGKERMLNFGAKIYEAIQSEKEMKILVGGSYAPFLLEPEDREAFRVPMSDFYRLTGVF